MKVLRAVGYTVKDAWGALGISRSGYYVQPSMRREKGVSEVKGLWIFWNGSRRLRQGIPACGRQAFWGYRRVRAWLVHREKVRVNEKRVRRVMKDNGLMATQTVHQAKRGSQRSKPRAEKPRQYWGIDMTKFMIPVLGWVYLVIVLDWYTKKIVGWDLSLRSRSAEWRQALEMGIEREFPEGVRGRGLKLIRENGSQPISVSFMRDMATLGIEQIFSARGGSDSVGTSYDNPKGNAETERMMRTVKEGILWLHEFSSLEEARERIGQWIEVDYSKFYVHSELGYISPEEFEALYLMQISLKEAT